MSLSVRGSWTDITEHRKTGMKDTARLLHKSLGFQTSPQKAGIQKVQWVSGWSRPWWQSSTQKAGESVSWGTPGSRVGNLGEESSPYPQSLSMSACGLGNAVTTSIRGVGQLGVKLTCACSMWKIVQTPSLGTWTVESPKPGNTHIWALVSLVCDFPHCLLSSICLPTLSAEIASRNYLTPLR